MVDVRFALIAAAALAFSGCTTKLYPRSSGDIRKAMGAALESGDKSGIPARAAELAAMGGTLSDPTLARIGPLAPQLEAKLRANRNSARTPELFAEVPAEYRLVEGIAWDAKAGRLFIGTVIDGRLAYRERDGGWHEVPLGNPRASLFGMAIDAPRRLLWITTGSQEVTAVAGERMTGLIAVDLDSLTVVRRVPLATGASGAAGDLVIAADGSVYVSNVLSGAIHRCRPSCTVMEDFLPAGSFQNPQGMAISADGKHLYIADYLSGLWLVDPRTGAKEPIRIGAPMMLDGIDGLVRRGDTLVAIQNGSPPRRVAVFTLGRGGTRIIRSTAWLTIAGDAGEPTLGTLDGDTLLFVGDGQWERYGPGGVLKDGKPLRPTPILRVRLGD